MAGRKWKSRASYFREYRAIQSGKARRLDAIMGQLCPMCSWDPPTVYWPGPRGVLVCRPCKERLTAWSQELAQAHEGPWAGRLIVHVFEKPWSEGASALCGAQAPEGPMMMDKTQPGERRKWPLCIDCHTLYPDPVDLPNNQEFYQPYAIPSPQAEPAGESELNTLATRS